MAFSNIGIMITKNEMMNNPAASKEGITMLKKNL